jgi:hypothetical protein
MSCTHLLQLNYLNDLTFNKTSAWTGGALPIPRPGADGSYGKGDYFQYINVPARKVFEWGYRRGNDPNHFREEYLSQKDHAFKAKVRQNVLS